MNDTTDRPKPEDFTLNETEHGPVIDWSAYKKAVVKSIDISTLDTRVLPLSTRVIPARLGVKKFTERKVYDGGYEYVLQVTVDGKYVGDAVDKGDGGGIYFYPNTADDRKVVDEIQNEYDALQVAHFGADPDEFWYSPESLWNHLVEEQVVGKTFARIVKANKKTIALPADWNGSPLRNDARFDLKHWEDVTWVTFKFPLEHILANAETVKAQAKVSHVWNGTEWQAL